jgi:chromosome transmission fidelity protein 1
MEARLEKIRAKEKAQKDRYMKGDQNFKKRKTDASGDRIDKGEEQFLLDDYDSDAEKTGDKKNRLDGVYSAATLELMEQLGMGKTPREEEVEAEDETKVRFLSRR